MGLKRPKRRKIKWLKGFIFNFLKLHGDTCRVTIQLLVSLKCTLLYYLLSINVYLLALNGYSLVVFLSFTVSQSFPNISSQAFPPNLFPICASIREFSAAITPPVSLLKIGLKQKVNHKQLAIYVKFQHSFFSSNKLVGVRNQTISSPRLC